jgi:hypothetical protein
LRHPDNDVRAPLLLGLDYELPIAACADQSSDEAQRWWRDNYARNFAVKKSVCADYSYRSATIGSTGEARAAPE